MGSFWWLLKGFQNEALGWGFGGLRGGPWEFGTGCCAFFRLPYRQDVSRRAGQKGPVVATPSTFNLIL